MKKTLTLSLLLACTLSLFAGPPVADFKKLNWLIGKWKRTNTAPGRSETEQWTRYSATELRGVNIQLKGKDTLTVEKARLIINNGAICYEADIPGNNGVVLFGLTLLNTAEFVCENPAHDFPKMIRYTATARGFTATISGNGKSIDYLFSKVPGK